VLRFHLKPEPKSNPQVIVGTTRFDVTKEGEWFEVKLNNLRSGDYAVKIILPGFEQEVEFKIKGGIEERGL
jgi:hypothetical protein